MSWQDEIHSEFARLQKSADTSVVEELAQHAEAAYEAARADGATTEDAEARVRALVESWCAGTSGPRRIERPALPALSPANRSRLAGLGLDIRLGLRLFRRQPGFAFVSIALIGLAIAAATSIFSVINGVVLKPLPVPGAEGWCASWKWACSRVAPLMSAT
jgi:hypothetical protein